MPERIRKHGRKFAWGCNVWGDTLCPSLVAFPPKDMKNPVLYGSPGTYDDLVREFLGEAEDEEDLRAFNDSGGEISEELAREKWLSALFELEHQKPRLDEVIAEHRAVAEKLGWIPRIGANTRKS